MARPVITVSTTAYVTDPALAEGNADTGYSHAVNVICDVHARTAIHAVSPTNNDQLA